MGWQGESQAKELAVTSAAGEHAYMDLKSQLILLPWLSSLSPYPAPPLFIELSPFQIQCNLLILLIFMLLPTGVKALQRRVFVYCIQ